MNRTCKVNYFAATDDIQIMVGDPDPEVSQLQSREPGEDPEDPYEHIDIETLPEWWQKAINEFRKYDLRPYRPPRFRDGALKKEVVEELESKYGIDISFMAINPQFGESWEVYVDGEQVGKVGRRRSPEGYTVYETSRDEFAEFIQSSIPESGSEP